MSGGLEILTLAEAERWDEAVRAIPGWDVYWLSGYARFWARNGDGDPRLALLEQDGARVAEVFLLRDIPGAPGRKDIATPYGYGGPLGCHSEAFATQFAAYCRAEGIVSGFVRYHPLLANAPPDAIPKGETVCLDLGAGPPEDRCKPEVRNRIRKAERAGLTVRLTPAPGPEQLAKFISLYHQTMDRREATDFYHFPDDCFTGLADDLPGHLLLGEAVLDGAVAAAALFLYNGTYLHYHLGGSDERWLHLAPNNLLFVTAARWGRERGIRLMHLGGGVRPGDSLSRFKGGFSPLRATFCVGQHIYDQAAYDELTAGQAGGNGYFPAYRAPVALMATKGER